MAEIIESVSDVLFFWDASSPETSIILNSYGTLEEANTYFDNRLRNEDWLDSTMQQRRAALAEATRLIDGLNFAGARTDETQNHQFPRGDDVVVPSEIEIACYEIALKLVQGFDPDLEINNLAKESQGISPVRSTYNRTFALEHIRAHIPSSRAWTILRPYLRDPKQLLVRRG